MTDLVPYTQEMFKAVHDRWSGPLHRAARRVVSVDDAEDIVQELFVELHERWTARGLETLGDERDPARAVGALLFWMLAKRLHSFQRTDARRAAVFERMPVEGLQTEVREKRIDAVEAALDVERVLSRLPSYVLASFQCICEQGMSVAETAALLGVKAPTVHVYVSMAKRALREALELDHVTRPRSPKSGDNQGRTTHA
ncbi:MAG: hypothetical protein NVS1B4_26260 [Gemmatimonadaceae bacterium]